MQPSLMLASLVLNEMEWLPKLYEQHRYWPSMVKWVFVESADAVYARANPSLVNAKGLSVDGTSDYLLWLAARDQRVQYIPLGFSTHADPAQGKVASRNAYAMVAEEVNPDYLLVVDADEFYCLKDQPRIVEYMARKQDYGKYAFVFRQREIWRPPSIFDKPLFDLEIKGSLWNITHARGWKWKSGLRYYEHNHLEECPQRYNTANSVVRFDDPGDPQYIHLGFASKSQMRLAKNAYYVERGEVVSSQHSRYVTCRDTFRTWTPGGYAMPFNSRVVAYDGPIPEVFQ